MVDKKNTLWQSLVRKNWLSLIASKAFLVNSKSSLNDRLPANRFRQFHFGVTSVKMSQQLLSSRNIFSAALVCV